jgi:hypothetical protein
MPTILGHDYVMGREWIPHTQEELRRQADTLRRLASYVSDRDLAHRLEEQATELSAKAESNQAAGQWPLSTHIEH